MERQDIFPFFPTHALYVFASSCHHEKLFSRKEQAQGGYDVPVQ